MDNGTTLSCCMHFIRIPGVIPKHFETYVAICLNVQYVTYVLHSY